MNTTTRYTKIDGQNAGKLIPGKLSPSKDQEKEKVSPPKKIETNKPNPIKPVVINDTPRSTIGIESKNDLPIVTPNRNRFQT